MGVSLEEQWNPRGHGQLKNTTSCQVKRLNYWGARNSDSWRVWQTPNIHTQSNVIANDFVTVIQWSDEDINSPFEGVEKSERLSKTNDSLRQWLVINDDKKA